MKSAPKPSLPIQRLMQEDFNIYFAAKLANAVQHAKHHPCFVDILDLLAMKTMLAYLFWLSFYFFFVVKEAPNTCNL